MKIGKKDISWPQTDSTQISYANKLSSTNMSWANITGPAVSGNICKHDRVTENHKNKLRDVETKLIQALSAKKWVQDPSWSSEDIQERAQGESSRSKRRAQGRQEK